MTYVRVVPMAVDAKKLYIRGLFSNGLGAAVLYGVWVGLGLSFYVKVAVGIQLAVFVLHGLPNRSEKYYDLSGSMTHFALVAASVAGAARVRSPRQLLVALCSVAWMVRLGACVCVANRNV